MIVRDLATAESEGHFVDEGTWKSIRLLLADARMGFSLHETVIRAGSEIPMHYKHHLEAVYCVGGEGDVEDRDTGEVHPLRDGTAYALDRNDRHILRAKTEMRMVCVFNPPLTGKETHGPDGAYPAADVQARLDAEGRSAKDLADDELTAGEHVPAKAMASARDGQRRDDARKVATQDA